jgi:septal ring factor EnvC (AmiA/AmiB activator)
MTVDIERTSLDAHVSMCELRYQALERRIDSLEQQLTQVNLMLAQIRDRLERMPDQQNQRWERVQWAVIGVLGSVAGLSLIRLMNL